MNRKDQIAVVALLSLFGAASSASAQIRIDRRGLLFGNPRISTRPATLDMARAIAETPEGRRIESERIERGTALHSILIAAATKRIRKVVPKVAAERRHDCVVRKGAIRQSRFEVVDLTDAVLAAIQS